MTDSKEAYYYISQSDDPFYNISLEDYLYTQCRDLDQIYFLWINRPSIFMGRYQTAEAETNTAYLAESDIPVLRRTSGGGTVYHDYGNLNFTSIKNDRTGRGFDLKAFPRPIVAAVASQDVHLAISPRGDLRLDGYKVAGSAEATRSGRMLYHLCILFDTNLNELERVLEVDPNIEVQSRVSSVRSSVCNLRPVLPSIANIQEFQRLIIRTIGEQYEHLNLISEERIDREYIERIRRERYENKEWIYSSIGRVRKK